MRTLAGILLLILLAPLALWLLGLRRQMWRSQSPWRKRRR